MNANTMFKSRQPLLMLELNELCPPIIDEMMANGELPNFKKLYDRSDVYVTHASDPDLEPWVQWVTFHTGLPQDVHGAKELDEGYRIELPRLWDKVGELGHSSLIFGSMNSNATSDAVTLMPDPWSTRVKPSVANFADFHDFIKFNVTEHTSKVVKPDKKMTMKFLNFVARNGLKVSTVLKGVSQIATEKTTGKDVKWRRALILDHLMWDVFEHLYKNRKPEFATFFANSTAFLQHRYWRHMKPESYIVKPSAEEMDAYGDAVRESYRHMDIIVGRATKLLGGKGRVIFVTALSQEANLRYEHIGGKFVYRPFDFKAFNSWLGGPEGASFEPVMTHQAWASFKTEADATRFHDLLASLRVDGASGSANEASVMFARQDGARVFFNCDFISKQPDDLVLVNAAGERVLFSKIFDLLGQVNNSQHCRDGAFWIERPDKSGRVHPEKLPLQEAHDAVMSLYA